MAQISTILQRSINWLCPSELHPLTTILQYSSTNTEKTLQDFKTLSIPPPPSSLNMSDSNLRDRSFDHLFLHGKTKQWATTYNGTVTLTEITVSKEDWQRFCKRVQPYVYPKLRREGYEYPTTRDMVFILNTLPKRFRPKLIHYNAGTLGWRIPHQGNRPLTSVMVAWIMTVPLGDSDDPLCDRFRLHGIGAGPNTGEMFVTGQAWFPELPDLDRGIFPGSLQLFGDPTEGFGRPQLNATQSSTTSNSTGYGSNALDSSAEPSYSGRSSVGRHYNGIRPEGTGFERQASTAGTERRASSHPPSYEEATQGPSSGPPRYASRRRSSTEKGGRPGYGW